MPITAEDYPVPHRRLLKGTGVIDAGELIKVFAASRSGEYRQTPFILDLTEAELRYSADDAYMLAQRTADEMRHSPLGPVAVVAFSDEVFGISRMFQAYSNAAGRRDVGVFRDMGAAERWLRTLR